LFPLKITWENGVSIKYKDTKIILDPQSRRLTYGAAFITHAHADHSRAFRVSHAPKFSSEETMKLVSIEGIHVKKWQPLAKRKKIVIGDVEVTPHPSGHVLGSYEFEVTTPDGTALFTGDLNTRHTRTVEPAEPVECDILIVESTFGSPDFIFPPDDLIVREMVEWANSILGGGKIPVFQADPLGNAQEIIRVFNENTNIPVISHWKVSRINKVYEYYGHKMEYVDLRDESAYELISRRNAVIVAPKRLNSFYSRDFVSAFVSGWALKFRRKSFPLSDHADFPNLIEFISRCNPKLVLTYHGGKFNGILAKYIERKLNIRAYPINLIPTEFSL